MNGHTSTVVTVRRAGDTYHARTNTGKASYRQKATSTSSAYFAARAAAEKFLCPGTRHVVVMSPTIEQDQFAESYTATLAMRGGAS